MENLVKRAQKGDTKAFSGLYETVYKDLYYFALYMMKNPQDAEDAVSETVISAYENIRKLRHTEAFRGWIFKILSNTCKRKLILRNQRENHEAAREMREDEAVLECAYEEAQDVRDAWKTLTDEERHILALSVFGGYNSSEIGQMLGTNGNSVNPNTIRSKRSRALEKMGKILK